MTASTRAPGLALHATAYGRPASERLRERIAAAKQGDALHPVTVVVPTNYVGVSARRLLASGALGPVAGQGQGLAGVTLVTVYRLAELLGAARLAADGRRPVSTPIVAAAIRGVLTAEPGIFADVADHPFTEDALVRSYRELSEVDASTLDALARQGPRAAEVVRVRRAARAQLQVGWFEEADLMTAAASAVDHGSPVLADLGTVVVHLPQDLSLPATRLIATLAEHAPVEVIAGRTGARDADGDVDRTLRRLGLTPPVESSTGAPPTGTTVESVSDAEEEARSAVHRIVDAARAGTPLERIAVLYPSEEPYARLVTEQLDAAGVAYNGRAIKPLSEHLVGRWLLELLALPHRRFERPAVLGLLTGAPVVTSRGRRVPSAAWERVSRDAGIVRDRGEWRDKLARLAGDMRHRAEVEEAEEDPRRWLIDRERRTADDAEALAAFTAELFGRLDAARHLASWSDLAAWANDTVRRYLGDERVREGWPETERDAAERVEAALDRLAGLDHVAADADLPTFRRTLALELDDDLGKVGEFGHGVLVGRVAAALGVDLDIVIVLGLAEGTLPTSPREDSLLPDSERRAARGELALRTERIGVEHRHLLAALAASSGERVLMFPRGDLRRSIERMPSRWLLDTAEALRDDGARELPDEAATDWYDRVDSFAQRVRSVAFPPTRQEYGLQALGSIRTRAELPAHPLVAADPPLRRGMDLVRHRASADFTRYDGNLGGVAEHLATPADADQAVAVTRLEHWLACPHAYLMEHVLRVEPVENPEELLEINPLERGTLVHDALEEWLREQLDDPPAPHEPWSPRARTRLAEIGEEHCRRAEARGVTGHALLWRRDRQRIMSDLSRFLDADDDRRKQDRLTPLGAEYAFGLGADGGDAVAVTLDGERTVWLRGRIDRVDQRADGGLAVVDYKTGGNSAYRDLKDSTPLGGDGSRLQLAVYGLAVARPGQVADQDAGGPRVRSEYWFVSTRGGFERQGFELTESIVAELEAAVRLVTDGIAAGHFPLRPAEPGWRPFTPCRYCDPDELGTTDRYRDWERIRQADALRGYVAHVEPGALADGQEAR